MSKEFLSEHSATYILFADRTFGKIRIGCTVSRRSSGESGFMCAAMADSSLEPFHLAADRAQRWVADGLRLYFPGKYDVLDGAGKIEERSSAYLYFFIQQDGQDGPGKYVNYDGDSGGLAFVIALLKGLMDKDAGPIAATGVITDPIDGCIGAVAGFETKLLAAEELLSQGKLNRGNWLFYPQANQDEGFEIQERLRSAGLRLKPVSCLREVTAVLLGSEPGAKKLPAKRAKKNIIVLLTATVTLFCIAAWSMSQQQVDVFSLKSFFSRPSTASIGRMTSPNHVKAKANKIGRIGNVSPSLSAMADMVGQELAPYLRGVDRVLLGDTGFRKRGTDILLPFSTVINEELAAALSRIRVKTTRNSQTSVKMRLTGNYELEKTVLLLTVSLVKLEGGEAVRIVTVKAECLRKNLREEWFRPDISSVAESLAYGLRLGYHGTKWLKIGLIKLHPTAGHVPLVFGGELATALESELAGISLFDQNVLHGTRPLTGEINGEYWVDKGKIVVETSIVHGKSNILSSSSKSFSVDNFPGFFFKPAVKYPVQVCYAPDIADSFAVDSTAARLLLGKIRNSLAPVFTVRDCRRPLPNAYKIDIWGFSVHKGLVINGYTTVLGRMSIRVISDAGDIIAVKNYTAKDGFMGLPEEAYSRIAEKIFSARQGQRLADAIWDYKYGK